MDDYEIVLKKWAWEKTCKDVPIQEEQFGKLVRFAKSTKIANDFFRSIGFNETVDWRDLRVSEYSEEGWECGSMSASSDSGFAISVLDGFKYRISTKDELSPILRELLLIEVTDEDRAKAKERR